VTIPLPPKLELHACAPSLSLPQLDRGVVTQVATPVVLLDPLDASVPLVPVAVQSPCRMHVPMKMELSASGCGMHARFVGAPPPTQVRDWLAQLADVQEPWVVTVSPEPEDEPPLPDPTVRTFAAHAPRLATRSGAKRGTANRVCMRSSPEVRTRVRVPPVWE
jgi:hypothetical protein